MVPDDVVDRLGQLYTATLSNALEDLGQDGVILNLPPVAPGMRMAGRAVTVLQMTAAAGDFPGSDYKVGAMIDAAGPGDVLVVANCGHQVSSWGGTATFAAKIKGIAGVIVDGGVRDREEILEHELPVFAKHLVPTTGRSRIRVVEIGGTVSVGGQKVATGDVVVADGTGIVCVPQAKAEQIVEIAEGLAADDAQAIQEIASGLTFSEAMAKFRKI